MLTFLAIFATQVIETPRASAASLKIVALGASNTAGKGVSSSQALPAQVQTMLVVKGYDAQVTNAGIAGDTTAGMLGRFESVVPAGTQVVILQPGGNDRHKGSNAEARSNNLSELVARLQARNIKVIVLDHLIASVPREYVQADGEHLTAGHALVAQRLVRQIIMQFGKRK
jgi:acyl-CoA thioesterase-1